VDGAVDRCSVERRDVVLGECRVLSVGGAGLCQSTAQRCVSGWIPVATMRGDCCRAQGGSFSPTRRDLSVSPAGRRGLGAVRQADRPRKAICQQLPRRGCRCSPGQPWPPGLIPTAPVSPAPPPLPLGYQAIIGAVSSWSESAGQPQSFISRRRGGHFLPKVRYANTARKSVGAGFKFMCRSSQPCRHSRSTSLDRHDRYGDRRFNVREGVERVLVGDERRG
jgi:hypothetical protein